jgi:hypothetical protein
MPSELWEWTTPARCRGADVYQAIRGVNLIAVVVRESASEWTAWLPGHDVRLRGLANAYAARRAVERYCRDYQRREKRGGQDAAT